MSRMALKYLYNICIMSAWYYNTHKKKKLYCTSKFQNKKERRGKNFKRWLKITCMSVGKLLGLSSSLYIHFVLQQQQEKLNSDIILQNFRRVDFFFFFF